MAGGVGAGDYIPDERDLFEISQDVGEPLIILFIYLLTLLPGDRWYYMLTDQLHNVGQKQK
jgi:hypothetical protein